MVVFLKSGGLFKNMTFLAPNLNHLKTETVEKLKTLKAKHALLSTVHEFNQESTVDYLFKEIGWTQQLILSLITMSQVSRPTKEDQDHTKESAIVGFIHMCSTLLESMGGASAELNRCLEFKIKHGQFNTSHFEQQCGLAHSILLQIYVILFDYLRINSCTATFIFEKNFCQELNL